MRYAAEFRRAWTGASGVAMDAGKKMLGYLANQKRLSGVDSLVQRITLEDGTVVEARWDKDIPTVRIYPGGGEEGCELYVESGLLDLGPNIASDASERFNRGLPEFSDDPATLHFGTGVDCTDGGFNGVIQVDGPSLSSQCLPSGGASATSRLTDPIKKQAQALQPASNWSGLMQRYVAAVYGSDLLDYSATIDTLTIGPATIPTADSVGLFDFDGTLGFIAIEDDVVSVREVTPSSDCVDAVIGAWRAMPSSSDAERLRKSKVLTIAMSGCVIGPVIATGTTTAFGNRHFINRAAWVFSHDDNKAVAVFETGGVATAYEATFTLAGAVVSASLATLATGDVLNGGSWPLLVASASPFGSPAAVGSGLTGTSVLNAGESYDFPVYAHYNDAGTPQVVRMSVVASDAGIVDQSACFSLYEGTPPSEGIISPAMTTSDSSNRVKTTIAAAHTVAYGYYATGWSDVSLIDCLDDDGAVVRSLGAKYHAITTDLLPKSAGGAVNDWSLGGEYFTVAHPSGATTATGFDSCLTEQTYSTGSATFTTSLDGYFETCVKALNGLDEYLSDPAVTLSIPYLDINTYVFNGAATAEGPQVLSLAWGASDALVVDAYTLKGGRGRYYSVEGQGSHIRSWFSSLGVWSFPDAALLEITGRWNTQIWAPDDCSTPMTGPQVVLDATFTSTAPAASGDVVGAAWMVMRYMDHDETSEHILYSTLNGSPASPAETFDVSTRYPDARVRGLETFASSVHFRSTTDTFTTSSDVDLALAAGSSYYNPAGTGTYVASDDAGDASDAFVLVGMQELVDTHLTANLSIGDGEAFALQNPSNPTWLVAGFAYQAARSLLGAQVIPTPQLARGNSTHMDRQTITGGYSPVSTPSFVGWA